MVASRFETHKAWGVMISHAQTGLRPKALTMCVCLVLGGHFSVANASWAQQTSSQSSRAKQSAAKAALLLVDTDDDCRLVMDDEDKGVITPEKSSKFAVGLGQHILKCTVVGVPDLVWRKVVDVRDGLQVAAVISLKLLHVQYDAAVANAKNQKAAAANEIDEKAAAVAALNKKMDEEDAAEKRRLTAKREVPQRLFEMVKGDWYASVSGNYQGIPVSVSYQYHFEGIEDGLIIAYLTQNGKIRYKVTFTPMPPNSLQAVSTQCFATKDRAIMKPGSKGNDGWGICMGKKNEGYAIQPSSPGGTPLQINGNTLTGVDGLNLSFTLTR